MKNNIKNNIIIKCCILIVCFILLDIVIYSLLAYNSLFFNFFKHNPVSDELFILNVTKSTITTIFVFILYFICTRTKIDKKNIIIKLYSAKAYLIYLIIFGIIISVLIPMFQIPDENTHINMIYEELSTNLNTDMFDWKYSSDWKYLTFNPEVKIDLQKYLNFNPSLYFNDGFTIPKITLIRHLPQAIGLLSCSLLHLPILVSSVICEAFAVFFYSFICYICLKIIPIKKAFMAGIMALPICIQQMGSFSYDVVGLSISFLLISYILYLKFTKDKVSLHDILFLLLLTFILLITKLPYVPILFTVLSIPINKFSFYQPMKKHKFITGVIISTSIIAATILFILILFKIDEGKFFLASLLNIPNTFSAIARTMYHWWFYYINQITGEFGWSRVHVSLLFTIFVIISIFIFMFYKNNTTIKNPQKDTIFVFKDKIFYILTASVIFVLICLSLYCWTITFLEKGNINNMTIEDISNFIQQNNLIYGIQGRYFIPIIPLLLSPFNFQKISNYIQKYNYKFYAITYYTILSLYMVAVILTGFWVL